MHKTIKKLMAVLLSTCLLSAMVMDSAITFTYASGLETTYSSGEEYFLAMDEDGNVTYTLLEEVETMSVEELEAIDNVSYEVVVVVDGEENIVSTVSTEAEAEAEAEMIQGVIDEQDTVEGALQEIGVELESTPVAEPLEIKMNDNNDEESEEAESVQLTFSVTTESASTKSSVTEADGGESTITVLTQQVTQDVEYGVLIISGYAEFKNEDGTTSYTHGSYGPDAAYLGLASDGTYIFTQSGTTGYFDTSEYSAYVIEYDEFISQGNIVSTYTTKNGNLYHNITTDNKTIASTQMVGYQQDYMTNNATYYSYDGIYFYTSYKTMITDYKNGTYDNAINASSPYYNYYQYLSQRTETNYTAEQIDEFISKYVTSSKSVLIGTGADFISNQDTYGINAMLMLGVAINESAWGTSSIATSKYNVFGHGAYDSNTYNAYTYTSVSASIKYHAETFMSKGYTNPKDSRYYGSHLGNKDSGANVKYASDPYWGEKAAAWSYQMEEYFSDATYDYGTYQIGVTSTKLIAYDTPGGSEIYNSISGTNVVVDNYPVVILGSVTYNGELWYKIQSDAVLNSSGTAVNTSSGVYDYDSYVVYVKAESITLVEYTDVEVEIPEEETYVVGDATGDGKISSADYIAIKNHIMGTKTIADAYLSGADANKDGKISSADYIAIKNHIMGTSLIQ